MTLLNNSRRSWHVRANAVCFGYAVLGIFAMAFPAGFEYHRWLVVHLFLLGAVTNCIVTWTEHFTVTLLRVPQPSRKSSAWRLIALNVAIIISLIGVAAGDGTLVVVGASSLIIVIAAHSYNLFRLSKKALQNRFAGTVRFYFAGAICLVIGIPFGVIASFQKDGSPLRDSMHVAHLHANLLGWIAITVLGTFFTLWPTILRTKMVDGVMRDAGIALPFLLIGIGTASLGLSLKTRQIAIVGMCLYAIGIGVVSLPFIRTWRQKAPHDLPTYAISFCAMWLVIGVVSDIVAMAVIGPLSDYVKWLDRFVPVFLIGFVAQLLLGALSFLVPVILGGGPAAVRKHIASLSILWKTRLIALNLGALFVALGGSLATTGLALLAFTLALFVGLVVWAVRSGFRANGVRVGIVD